MYFFIKLMVHHSKCIHILSFFINISLIMIRTITCLSAVEYQCFSSLTLAQTVNGVYCMPPLTPNNGGVAGGSYL
jgi:hypothetical protein